MPTIHAGRSSGTATTPPASARFTHRATPGGRGHGVLAAVLAMMLVTIDHYTTQITDFGAESHEQMMLALGLQSKREITRTRIRVRAAMATQTREQGRYLGGRPPSGTGSLTPGRTPTRPTPRGGRRAHRRHR